MVWIPSTKTVAILISRSKVFWVMRLLGSVDCPGLLFFESLSVCFDEFDSIDDHLKGAARFPFLRFPLGLLQKTDYSDAGTGMEVFLCNLGILVKTDTFQPSGFVSSGFEGQGKRCNGVSSLPKKISGSLPRLPVRIS